MKLAIISDIHSNLQAFEAVLKHINEQKADRIISIGDLIDYGGQPNEVVSKVRELGIESVTGNHEYALANPPVRMRFTRNAQASLKRTEELLEPEHLTFLCNLSRNMEYEGILFVHGLPPKNVSTYLYELPSYLLVNTFLSYSNFLCFVGHSHIPSMAVYDGENAHYRGAEAELALDTKYRYILNPGSVGQPRNGIPDASYMILDTESHTVRQFYVPYDIGAAAKMILKNGFPACYAERIYMGF